MKMSLHYLLFAAVFSLSVAAKAQVSDAYYHTSASVENMGTMPSPTSAGYSGTGANIDVLYHRAAWRVNPNSAVNYVAGTITTYFKTLQSAVSAISFDLNKTSFNNASLQVTYHGTNCVWSFPSTGNVNILNITLPVVISSINTVDSITISYAGTPVADGLGGGLSTRSYTDQFGNTQKYIMTLSESYEDRNWWPCKADMQDKIDSMDIAVTVPWKGADTFWVASNGRLIDSTLTDTLRTFTYKSRYPIASYLVCIAAAKYNRYYSSISLNNTIIPVAWYLLAGKTASYYTNAVTAMQKMNAVVLAYSSKLGDYPFKDEKHGYYDGLNGAGGMEHQTFSAIASNSLTSLVTLDHELMHQWFGDNVTFATWNDLWLAEGFARYGEALAAELVPSLGYTPYSRRNNFKNSALNLRTTSLWIPDASIASSTTIWNSSYGSAVYERGGMVVTMLRAIAGDQLFFTALKNYQAKFAGRSANADSLKKCFNDVLGKDLTPFFNDYVGGSGNGTNAAGGLGNPVNQVKWNSTGSNRLLLGIQSQTQTTGSNVAYFNGPVVVHVTGVNAAAQDTTIRFFDWGAGNLSYAGNGLSDPMSGNVLSYDLSFAPVNIVYDDSAYTLSTGTVIQDTSLKGYTWYGTADNNWNNAANWASCCGVPPSNADVTIATVTYAPVLSAAVTVHHITINDGKYISLGDKKLTVTGAVDGNGVFAGSLLSGLILKGKAGSIRFSQNNDGERSLQQLIVDAGSNTVLSTDLQVTQMMVSPAANFTVLAGVKLVTK